MSTNEESTTQLTTNEDVELLVFQLEPKQQRFVQLYMTGAHTIPQIAQLLQMHPNTLWKWLKRPEIRDAIDESQGAIHEQVGMQIKNMTLSAIERLHSLIESPIDAVALQAVKDVLDRGGHKTKNEIKVEKTVTTIEQKFKELIDSTIIDMDFEEMTKDDAE